MNSRTILDNKPLSYCEGCRRETGTTVCGLCLPCARPVVADRRKQFPKSEGNTYFRRVFGLKRYFEDDGRDFRASGSHRNTPR